MKKKIFVYSSPETEQFIEENLKVYKDRQGIPNNFLLEKWILLGMTHESDLSEEANNIISRRYGGRV